MIIGLIGEHRSFDLVSVKCSRCEYHRDIYYHNYLRNLAKNDGEYVCHGCKTAGTKTALTCKGCKKEFFINGGYLKGHNNRRQFCSLECSRAYQQQLYADIRKNGKKCAGCGDIKPANNFKPATGKKNSIGKLSSYCKECRKRYRIWISNKTKIKAIRYKGGKCQKCGDRAGIDRHPVEFDFRHRDPAKKEFSISNVSIPWESLVLELDKCDLLCSGCHRVEHIESGLWPDYCSEGSNWRTAIFTRLSEQSQDSAGSS